MSDVSHTKQGLMTQLRSWTANHEGLWQFIKFNVLSNISTLTRFVLAMAGSALFIKTLHLTSPFSFLIFDYTAQGSGGVGGFITFLIAETAAQVVNFFAQMKWVFNSNEDYGRAAPKYAVLAVLIVVVNLVLPGHIIDLCTQLWQLDASLASFIASSINTGLAVLVSFPLLKYWIAPSQTSAPRKSAAPDKATTVPGKAAMPGQSVPLDKSAKTNEPPIQGAGHVK